METRLQQRVSAEVHRLVHALACEFAGDRIRNGAAAIATIGHPQAGDSADAGAFLTGVAYREAAEALAEPHDLTPTSKG
jgi:hypothetical protein